MLMYLVNHDVTTVKTPTESGYAFDYRVVQSGTAAIANPYKEEAFVHV
ncbi:MAG: hypothetical protein GX640_19450 [Fibrobacter sp.]|nr:hypothetical protein [Fibrobacter sp.]